MPHITSSVEYAIHCLIWMIGSDHPRSARDLAEFQGISAAFLSKILPMLEKAGIVGASAGIRGGYRLERAPEDISLLQVVDAIEGRKPLFECHEIRRSCALFQPEPPGWAVNGPCSIHRAMMAAEKAMRESLASQSLADIAKQVAQKAPDAFSGEVSDWLDGRLTRRTAAARDRKGLGSAGKPRARKARSVTEGVEGNG